MVAYLPYNSLSCPFPQAPVNGSMLWGHISGCSQVIRFLSLSDSYQDEAAEVDNLVNDVKWWLGSLQTLFRLPVWVLTLWPPRGFSSCFEHCQGMLSSAYLFLFAAKPATGWSGLRYVLSKKSHGQLDRLSLFNYMCRLFYSKLC